jgi:hypothetical protein
MLNKEEVEMLIRIDERTKKLEHWMEQHITLHHRSALALYGSLSAVILALLSILF